MIKQNKKTHLQEFLRSSEIRMCIFHNFAERNILMALRNMKENIMTYCLIKRFYENMYMGFLFLPCHLAHIFISWETGGVFGAKLKVHPCAY